MTIRYQNGQTTEAITLSNTDEIMRVVLQGMDDAVELTRVQGTWITEDCEPVLLDQGFGFGRGADAREDDCLCPAELAAHLIRLLPTDSSEDVWAPNALCENPPFAVHTAF